ncbi:MAG: hypothetical protein ACK48Y_21500 [Planctomyces sp.]
MTPETVPAAAACDPSLDAVFSVIESAAAVAMETGDAAKLTSAPELSGRLIDNARLELSRVVSVRFCAAMDSTVAIPASQRRPGVAGSVAATTPNCI